MVPYDFRLSDTQGVLSSLYKLSLKYNNFCFQNIESTENSFKGKNKTILSTFVFFQLANTKVIYKEHVLKIFNFVIYYFVMDIHVLKFVFNNINNRVLIQKRMFIISAYIKPERVTRCDSHKDSESANDYYDHINKIKFTSERRRHLSSLLGSNTVQCRLQTDSGIDVGTDVGSVTDRTVYSTNSECVSLCHNDGTGHLATVSVHFKHRDTTSVEESRNECNSIEDEEERMLQEENDLNKDCCENELNIGVPQLKNDIITPLNKEELNVVAPQLTNDIITPLNKHEISWPKYGTNGASLAVYGGDQSLNKMIRLITNPVEFHGKQVEDLTEEADEETSLLHEQMTLLDDVEINSHHSQEEDTTAA